MADLNEAFRLEPSNAVSLSLGAELWVNKHDYDRAMADFDAALRIDPNYFKAYYNRALMTCPSGIVGSSKLRAHV